MNYDVILVEGSDCSGKTSLIELLSKELGFKVVRGSSFELSQCTNEELYEKFKEMTKEENVIFDRFIYSNEVYAQLFDDFAILTNEQRFEIEDSINSRAMLVYLEADMNTLTTRMDKRGDDYVTVDRLQGIKDKYEESLSKSTLDYIRIDTSNITPEQVLDMVMREVTLKID